MIPAEVCHRAFGKLRAAATDLDACGPENPELQKLAGEIMTLASVAEILSHVYQDNLAGGDSDA